MNQLIKKPDQLQKHENPNYFYLNYYFIKF